MSGSIFLGNTTLANGALQSFGGKIEASFFSPSAGGSLAEAVSGGGDPVLTDYDKKEIKRLLGTKMMYDNKTASEILDAASKRSGLDKSFLSASALQEGMNLAIKKPDEASEAYTNAKVDPNKFPVDGFSNYGLDTFGEAHDRLVKKGYLPKDFSYFPYKAKNEQNMEVTTAAFRNNEDAVTAKAAYMRDFMDSVNEEAGKRGLKLNDRELKYFTMAGYNGGPGAIKIMLDELKDSKGSAADYIKTGSKKKGQVHKNVSPRMQKMDYFTELFNQKTN